MRTATLQMVSTPDVQENLRTATQLLLQASRSGAELAVLPEYFCFLGMRETDKLAISEAFGDGPIQQQIAATARELGLWIVAGTIPIRPDEDASQRAFNSTLVFNPRGQCVARYDKIHLFRYHNPATGERYDESHVLCPGHQPVQFDLPSCDGHLWRIGLSICYDLRFPELYRAHARAGAHLMLVPSAFTFTTGEKHWEVLLRARAIENLCWVIGSAQGGTHANGRRTWGHSMVVHPWGEVAGVQASGAGALIVDIDFAALEDCRNQLPALQHRVLG